jgi:hypothetical protein
MGNGRQLFKDHTAEDDGLEFSVCEKFLRVHILVRCLGGRLNKRSLDNGFQFLDGPAFFKPVRYIFFFRQTGQMNNPDVVGPFAKDLRKLFQHAFFPPHHCPAG